jgi:GntR family histidine utilization transcriptional repressor
MTARPPRGWEGVRAEVLARIRAGLWRPGQPIPGEEALARELGVARATVNRALQALAEAGVVERRRRAGSRVAPLPVRRAAFAIPVIRAEVEARGAAHTHRLLACAPLPPPAEVAARLRLAPDAPLWRVETLHLADGRPFAHEGRWLNPAVLPAPPPDFAAISANEWLVGHVPLVEGDITLSAEPAGAAEAAALDLPPGTAVFVTERTTFGPAGGVTWVRLTHAPGYRLRTEL